MLPLISKEIVEKYRLADTSLLVILNGVLQERFSHLPRGVNVYSDSMQISRGLKLKNPLHLLFLFTGGNCRRWRFLVEASGSVTTIEEYVFLGAEAKAVKMDAQIEIKENGHLCCYRWGALEGQCYLNTVVEQRHGSKMVKNFIHGNGENFKEELTIHLAATHAEVNIRGIDMLRRDQKSEHKILVEHGQPNCTSNVLVKSILGDSSVNNFDCKVVVHRDAIGSRAEVVNQNLLLSNEAVANSSPELEIYADDVLCNHGATVGSLDQEAIFYLQSRGIAREDAMATLTMAFAKDIFELFPHHARLITDYVPRFDNNRIDS